MIFLLDNYDSFTYNLAQYLRELGQQVEVHRNDALSLEAIEALRPAALVISPGPCAPSQAGLSVPAVRHFAGRLPILGVCLGHQSIGAAFGAQIVRAQRLMHGKTSPIEHDGRTIFRGLPQPFAATRYHSLVIDSASLPDCLEVSAQTATGVIMAVRHRELPIEGVQFHPESILTLAGRQLLANFLEAYVRSPSISHC